MSVFLYDYFFCCFQVIVISCSRTMSVACRLYAIGFQLIYSLHDQFLVYIFVLCLVLQFELDADKGIAVLYVKTRENFDTILSVSISQMKNVLFNSYVLCLAYIYTHVQYKFWFWRYLTRGLFWHLSQSPKRPSIYFSSILKSRSNLFLEPISNKQ